MSKYIDKDKVLEYIIFGVVGKDITCGELKRAIESLPAIEVSEDCISRQDALEALDRIGSLDTEADREYARDIFDSIPLVTPTVSEDCISREWVLSKVYDVDNDDLVVDLKDIENAPSVTPTEQKPVLTEEVREALIRLTMCARGECSICKYEHDCGFDKQVEMATENMNTILKAFKEPPTERTGWICPKCDVHVHSDFDSCPHCGFTRADMSD